MVLESVVSSVLNQVLSAYVENFNPKQLNVGIWGGDIKLKDLKLKRGALDKFRLPVDVVEGSIGSLVLTVPWTALGSRPVKAVIEDIYLLAVPASESKFDPEEDDRRKQASKMEKLKNAELLLTAPSGTLASPDSTTDESNKNESFIAAMTNKILDNLQLRIKNVHIRYEDKMSVPGHPFAVGFTLAELSAVSTDEDWQESFVIGPKTGVHKLTKLDSLSIYFNTDSVSLANSDDPAFFNQQFTELIPRTQGFTSDSQPHIPDHQYVLKPVSGEGKLILRKHPTKVLAKIDCELIFSELAFLLDADQYRDALSCLDLFHFYTRHRDYLRFRPSDEEFKTNKAKAQWEFAKRVTRHEVHEKAYKWSWAYFRQRRDDRKAYVRLYKAAQQGALPPSAPELAELEKRLSYQDIRFYRSLARSEMRKERITAKQQQLENTKSTEASSGWLGWMWGGNQSRETENDEEKTEGVLTEEERKQLYDAIEWDEDNTDTNLDLPRDAIHLNVQAKLKTGSFTLRSGKVAANSLVSKDPQAVHDIISLVFDGFAANAIQRTDNSEFSISLAGFRVYDGTVKGTKHPQIVRVKDGQSSKSSPNLTIAPEADSSSEEGGTEIQVAAKEALLDPFFCLKFEHKPLDERADNGITLNMRHMEIVYHPGYVEDVAKFFRPPASQLESIGALMDVATETLEGIRKETRAGLEFALQTHKTVDIKVDMNAPIIIVPEDVTQYACPHIMLDAGHISVSSNLVPQEGLEIIKTKQNQHYTDDDHARLESMMYDRFHVELKDTQLLLGKSFQQCSSALHKHEGLEDVHLLERISMHFDVLNCIVDNAPNLTRFKIEGDLPELKVNFSDRKYAFIMSMIDVALPKFQNSSDQPDSHQLEKQQQGLKKSKRRPSESPSGRRRSGFSMPTPFLSDRYNVPYGAQKDAERYKDIVVEPPDLTIEEDEFFEAPDLSQVEQTVNFKQKNVEFNFTVGKLTASISKAGPDDEDDIRLVDSVLEGFSFGFVLRNYDLGVKITLHSMYIEDRITPQTTSAFKKLATSQFSEDSSSDKIDLVKFQYTQVQSEHPEFMTCYEGMSKIVDADLSTINVSVTRPTILELFDWVMNTFTDTNPQPNPTESGANKTGDHLQPPQVYGNEVNHEKLRVKAKLRTIAFVLNDGGTKLATLSLSAADVSVLLNGPAMRVNARLGSLTLRDDTEASKSSQFRNLVEIQGDDLADFQYETFPRIEHSSPGPDSMVYLRSGSIQFTFVDDILHRILVFFSKFARMKAVMDAASQAARQQASDLAQTDSRMSYDVLIRTPIIVFPREGSSTDSLIAHLGEINASNTFSWPDGKLVTKTEAGLHNIRLTSQFYHDNKCHSLQLLGDVNIDVVMASFSELNRSTDVPQGPDTDIAAHISDVKVSLTQAQYSILLQLATSVPKVFDLSELDAENDQPDHKNIRPAPVPRSQSNLAGPVTDMLPEVAMVARTASGREIPLWTTMEVAFTVSNVTLELFDGGMAQAETYGSSSLAKFSLNGTRVHFKTQSDGSMSAEFLLKALRAIDTRTSKATKFREIIPVVDHDSDQLMFSYNQTAGGATLNFDLDSPNIILSVDYLLSISAFFTLPPSEVNTAPETSPHPPVPQAKSSGTTPNDTAPESTWSYHINIIKPKLTILSDPERHDSDAVHLTVEKISVSQQGALAVSICNLGMSLGNMGDGQDGVKFLDECTMTLAVDQRAQKGRPIMSMQAHTTPLIIRVSYRDFLLIYSIYGKAVDYSQAQVKGGEHSALTVSKEGSSESIGTPMPAIREDEVGSVSSTKTKENLSVTIEKLQVILIGDIHEQPLVHLSTQEFVLHANDWSDQLSMEMSICLLVDYYNLTNSHWEPLMDPWPMCLKICRKVDPVCLTVALESKKRLELNVTATFIDLTMTSLEVWGREGENVLHKRRGMTAPYLIKNRTGYAITVWADSYDEKSKPAQHVIKDDDELPWRFEDWKLMRENVSSSSQDTLGVILQDAGWEPVTGVSVIREGEQIYSLRPSIENVTHRLLCHVEICDNRKVVTLRSTFQVKNDTALPIEMCVVGSDDKRIGSPYKIVPGGSCCVPIEAAYHQRIRIRPDAGFGFGWCKEAYSWKDLVKRPVQTISCHAADGKEPPRRFNAATVYDQDDPVVRHYPIITLLLRAPIEVENLLPYDIKYRIYLKEQGHTYSAFLRKGGSSPVHIVDPMDLTLLGVEFQEEGVTGFQKSDYSIVNTDNPEDLPIENRLEIHDDDGLTLNLRLHYMRYPMSGGACKIQIYCPYVVINKTGLDFAVRSKPFMGSAKSIAGQNLCGNASRRREPRPFLFSHLNDDKRNRAVLRVGDSDWSKPISFDVVGANQQVTMQTSTKSSEFRVGLSISEGLGNYKLTKVVIIYPRFIVSNKANIALHLREKKASEASTVVKPGKRALLSLFKDSSDPQLVLSLDGKQWSKAFRIQNVGKVYIRVLDLAGVESLVHAEILLQGPSIFIKLDVNSEQWPFIIRNKSTCSVVFGQTLGESVSKERAGIIRSYRSLPGSETPYAWDEPASGLNSLIRVIVSPPDAPFTSSSAKVTQVLYRDVHVLEVGQLEPLRTYKKGHKLAFDVVVQGQAQVLVISDYNEATNIWKVAKKYRSSSQIQRSDTFSSQGEDFETANVTPVTSLTAAVSLEGIGISVIDKRLRELVYASFRGIDITFEETQLQREYGLIVRWIQLDNQLDGALFPVLFGPTDLPVDPKEIEIRPNLQIQANIVKDDKHGVVYFKYATILMQKMSLEMDESFVIALLGFTKFSGASWQKNSTNRLTNEPDDIPEPDSEGGGLNLYFELLHLQPFVIVISFERQDSVDVTERTFDSRNPLYFLLNAVTMAIGTISGAPITLNQLKIESARMTQGQLINRLIQHYQNQGLSQLYRVLASADFLGNPAGLFSNVSSGVQDLFYEPFNGVVLHGGGELGVGIARGAASLVKKSAFGVTDSVSKITGSVSKGLSAAALDSTWARERQRRQFRNRNKINGFATGASAFVGSLASGIQGVAMKPIQGAESEGAAGFFKGIGKGLVGVVAKPAVGTFDFLSNVSGGLRNATSVFDPSRGGPARLPRYIASDGILRPYNAGEALGQDWLRSVDHGKYHSSKYVAHVELPNDVDSVCILTTEEILMIRMNKLTSVWHVYLSELKEISFERKGIRLSLRDGRTHPFLALEDSATRFWFFEHIQRVVRDYNTKRQRATGGDRR
ncbi:hypothetical protein CROQUDRAFT_660682 [Cronartium quercuum f. sp. fusiforme G11]|uniref:Vacuolar protein sorting-associated protein n=1 Tax=Cronartium quercuum f. sp. fusiforme G11 TaxID=708437 RepID=A0A9P6NC01_9BASI|nr:hypothetical protein CROQUDRAFT_660682 [Cronartium quercuum f. sp. fusiforme G11]